MHKKAVMGIDTLIIFIASILVATIAAGVILTTQTTLQNKALEVGKAGQKKITQYMDVVQVKGVNPVNGQVSDFEDTLKLSAASDPIRFNKTAIRIVTQAGSATLTYGGIGPTGYTTNAVDENGTYTVEYVREATTHVDHLLKEGEIARVHHGSPTPLYEGASMEISIIPQYGDESIVSVNAPNVMTAYKVKLYP